MRRTFSAFASLILVFLLAGCAGVRLVDNDVRSFSTLPAIAPGSASYRFERLPSQQSHSAAQDHLESVAQKALAKVGLPRDDANAKYSVQVGARLQVDPRAPWDDPWYGGWGFGGYRRGHYFGPGFGMGWSSPYYRREVSVVMRDLATSKVVYETHAAHEGRWSDDNAVFPAMFDAALKGFPQPPQGPRRVDVQIGG
jgi:Domain of unknown function (DUF4136)